MERVKLTAKQENRLANNLRTPMRTIIRFATTKVQRELVAKTPGLPPTRGRLLVTAAAQENFDTLRPTLAALLQESLADDVAQQIHDDISIRSRSAARGALPRLLLPLDQIA